jgi:hypothetical protein
MQSLRNRCASSFQSLCTLYVTALLSLRNCCATATESLCNRFAIATKSILHTLSNRSEINTKSLCNRLGIALQSPRNRFAIDLALCNCFAIALNSLQLLYNHYESSINHFEIAAQPQNCCWTVWLLFSGALLFFVIPYNSTLCNTATIKIQINT